MPNFQSVMSERGRKNYEILWDVLKRTSYKPGWHIFLTEEPSSYRFVVQIIYEGYESENAVETPLSGWNEQAVAVAGRILGKTLKNPETRSFSRTFDMFSLDAMAPEHVIQYIIGGTIKQAEMFEFERWFKVEGNRIFGDNHEQDHLACRVGHRRRQRSSHVARVRSRR